MMMMRMMMMMMKKRMSMMSKKFPKRAQIREIDSPRHLSTESWPKRFHFSIQSQRDHLAKLERLAYWDNNAVAVKVYHGKSICMGLSFDEPTILILHGMYINILQREDYAFWFRYSVPAVNRYNTVARWLIYSIGIEDVERPTHIVAFLQAMMIKLGCEDNEEHVASLHGKLGNTAAYISNFERLGKKGSLAFKSLFFAHVNNMPMEAIATFEQMLLVGIKPTHQMCRGVLSAHVRCGTDTSSAVLFFKKMHDVYKITPNLIDFSCLLIKFMRSLGVERAIELLEVNEGCLSNEICNIIFGECTSQFFEGHTYDVGMAERMVGVIIRDGGKYQLNYTAYSRLEAVGFQFPPSLTCMPTQMVRRAKGIGPRAAVSRIAE